MIASRRFRVLVASAPLVVGAMLVISACTLIWSDRGLLLLVGERARLADREGEAWVVITQTGDCDAFLARARTFARASGWPRPVRIRNLALSEDPAVDQSPSIRPERVGSLRDAAIRWALAVRGLSVTPLLLRVPGADRRIEMLSLDRLPE